VPAKPKKEMTEKQKITLRVKNNEPIDWGSSDDDDDDDDANDEKEQLERSQEEREIEQEH
jgi:hypothetical protein